MGREIRKIVPGWEHPKDENGNFIPLYDQYYEDAAQEWIANFIAWDIDHTDPDYKKHPEYHFWEWDGSPPDPESYRKEKWTVEPTWYQMYETISEGTPVSPAFATKQELIDYLVRYGDYWDQKRGDGGWSREAAQDFVDKEWAPSMIVSHTETSYTIYMPRDYFPTEKDT